MHNRTKILVFPCGSEIGLEIHAALRWSKHVELFGATSVPNHGAFVFQNYIEGLPDIEDKGFISELENVIRKFSINFIFPAHDSVVLKLLQNQDKLSCGIISSPVATAEICRSKKRTYEHFQGVVRTPKIYKSSDVIEQWPVFLKPDIGQGSRGTAIAHTVEDVRFFIRKDPSLLILEYLPGAEYTIDCFTDHQGVLRFCGPRVRERISNGISVATHEIEDDRFQEIAQAINSKLQFRGVWFFQLKVDVVGELTLLEVAPRVSGSMALYRNKGVNFALLSIFDALGENIDVLSNQFSLQADRALCTRFTSDMKFSHVYVDLDDTLIISGKVNAFLTMFLYQSINRNVKTHLISRHESKTGKDIEQTLREYRIRELFDDIIRIEQDERKSGYITEKDSIFIDDSFSERVDIFRTLGIPVFDLDAVESLIDWKA